MVDLFDLTPKNADGSHHVVAPGGYEAWHLFAHDPMRNLRLKIGFHDGYVLHPDYVGRYAAYRRRPTRHRPPVPSEFPCVTVAVFEDGRSLGNCVVSFGLGAFRSEPGAFSLGANRLSFCSKQVAVEVSRERSVSLTAAFRPAFAVSTEKVFPPRGSSGIEHHWRYAAPVCDVQAEVRLEGRTIQFEGSGQCNHYFGSGPPGWTADRWMRGQILFPRAAVDFLAADDRAIVLTADESGLRQIDNSPIVADWDRRSSHWLRFASAINFGGCLLLRNPRVALDEPANLSLIYDAYVDGQQCPAWVEVEYPNRLRHFWSALWARRWGISE